MNLNVEKNVYTGIKLLFYVCARRAIVVSHIFRMLKKLVVCDHLLEAVRLHEKILSAVYLIGSGLTGRDGGRKANVTAALNRLEHDCALSRTGRA